MDNAMYVGLSRQMTLRRELDIAANNMANVDTAGFKLEDLMLRADPQARAKTAGVSSPVVFNMDDGVARDFGQGALRTTGGPLDLAIEGQGFFKVVTTSGQERYTRDGRFKLDDSGRLITQDGSAVQGGGDIVLDATKGPVTISETGVISQGGQKVGQVDVVRFPDLSALSKDGDNRYRNTTNVPPVPATDAKVRQGALEGSNVQPIVQMTRLIDITRAYETITNLMSQSADLSRRSIQRLGAVS